MALARSPRRSASTWVRRGERLRRRAGVVPRVAAELDDLEARLGAEEGEQPRLVGRTWVGSRQKSWPMTERQPALGVAATNMPPGRSARAASATICSSTSGCRCSTKWALKTPPSESSGRAARPVERVAERDRGPACAGRLDHALVEVDALGLRRPRRAAARGTRRGRRPARARGASGSTGRSGAGRPGCCPGRSPCRRSSRSRAWS